MRCAERGVTLADILHQNSYGTNVENVLETAALSLHLAPDTIDMFRSSADLGFDFATAKLISQA